MRVIHDGDEWDDNGYNSSGAARQAGPDSHPELGDAAKSSGNKTRGFPSCAGGSHRWFAVNESGAIQYSSFPRSFASEQQAWEHAEWACGASATLVYEHPDPDQRFELYAEGREISETRPGAR